MLFNTFSFWAGFSCLWLLLRLRISVPWRNFLLLSASYWIAFKISGAFAAVLAFSTLLTFCIGILLSNDRWRTSLFWLGISLNIGVLAYFKYANFFAFSLSEALPIQISWATTHIFLPIGISYYTFQAMGYLIDVYQRKYEACTDPLAFAVFMSFFPKIIAGPIEKGDGFLQQLRTIPAVTWAQFKEGLFLVFWGLVKKFVISGHASFIADAGFNNPSGANFYLILAAFAFTLQIYADFSGYSDIAKGVAALLGFRLKSNFDMPYVARDPQEFWKRWHISLSEWFRDYVYIPLGGNRRGKVRMYFNLLITMMLVGLWHGASWTYVIWGLYWGVLMICYRLAQQVPMPFLIRNRPWLRIPAWAFFFTLTTFGWVIFRSESLTNLGAFLSNVSLTTTDNTTIWYLLLLWFPIVAVEIFQWRKKDAYAVARLPLVVQLIWYFIAFYSLILLTPSTFTNFIYSKF